MVDGLKPIEIRVSISETAYFVAWMRVLHKSSNYIIAQPRFGVSTFEIARNQGIFWEPGILQIFMNLLLFIEAFILKKRGLVFWLSILSIVSTFSTTGLLVMFIQLILYFFNTFKQNIYISILVFGVIGVIYVITAANVQNKISGDGQVSFQARLFDLVQPLYILADHPLTGVGLDDEQYVSTRQNTSYSLNLNTTIVECYCF